MSRTDERKESEQGFGVGALGGTKNCRKGPKGKKYIIVRDTRRK